MINRTRIKARRTNGAQIILFFLTITSLISLMYRDLQVGLKMFTRPSLAQTSIDDKMQRIHLSPIFGGHDLTPPHRLATPNGKVSLEPIMGSHQYDNDAVFAIGNTLDYEDTVLFITSLRQSGFEGDIVLSTIDKSAMEKKLVDFLEYHSQEGARVIVYDGVIRLEGTDENFSKEKNVTSDYVYLRGLYQDLETGEDLDDARIPRSLGVARFELYWAWSTKYSPASRILLVDADDTYFQISGEVGIGVGKSCSYPIVNNRTEFHSVIHIYEENQKNKKHRLHNIKNKTQLVEAYKKNVILDFACNENVLTPASTHGHQRAIEGYLRAMVKQFDYTQCAKYWCEWAFHNYLFYLGVLWSIPEVDEIKPHMQGTGAINSIGQDVPLNTSSMFDSKNFIVNNRAMGNGILPSWSVHQYKSDETLYHFINVTKRELVAGLDFSKHPFHDLASVDLLHKDSIVTAKPTCGHHRRKENAIFSIVSGNDLDALALFILSAREKGFKGDIVLHAPTLSNLSQHVASFLKGQCDHGVVLYEGYMVHQQGDNWIMNNFYSKSSTKEAIPDPRPGRSKRAIRLELFSAWIDKYDTGSSLLLTDGEQTFFQSNPFAKRACNLYELHVFQEHSTMQKFSGEDDPLHRHAFATMFSEEEMDVTFKSKEVINPDTVFGHKDIVKELVVEMINVMEEYKCVSNYRCDWAAVNYIWFKKGLPSREDSISYEVEKYKLAEGKVLLPMELLDQMKTRKLFDNDKSVFRSWDGSVMPVVLRYDKYTELKEHYEAVAKHLLEIQESIK